jgi:hypothetical protein
MTADQYTGSRAVSNVRLSPSRAVARSLRAELRWYLDGLRARDFDFLGIVERFDEDVRRFERWSIIARSCAFARDPLA